MATIGFIGLGNMGLPMAQNLLKAGHEVQGFDVGKAQMDALAASGGSCRGKRQGRGERRRSRHHHAAGRTARPRRLHSAPTACCRRQAATRC